MGIMGRVRLSLFSRPEKREELINQPFLKTSLQPSAFNNQEVQPVSQLKADG
jgi:hypothetical protein